MLKFLSALASIILFVWFFRGFMPVLRLRIVSRCVDQKTGRFVIGLEVENKSRIAVRKKKARIQILEHGPDIPELMSEWVPFAKERLRTNEPPLRWREPEEVLSSTTKIEPGESIYVELLYTSSPPSIAIHCAFQFQIELNLVASAAYKCGYRVSETWTTTAWITRKQE